MQSETRALLLPKWYVFLTVFSNLTDIHTLKSIAGALSPMVNCSYMTINALFS